MGESRAPAAMGAGGSHQKESAKGKEWDFKMEVTAKLNDELARAVADAEALPARRQRELEFAQAEEAARLAREDQEKQKLEAMIEQYNAASAVRDVQPLQCVEQREAFLACFAKNGNDPTACISAVADFHKCSQSLTKVK